MYSTHARSRLLVAVIAVGSLVGTSLAQVSRQAFVVGVGEIPIVEPQSWTRHLIWIVPLALLLMILILLMRRRDDE